MPAWFKDYSSDDLSIRVSGIQTCQVEGMEDGDKKFGIHAKDVKAYMPQG